MKYSELEKIAKIHGWTKIQDDDFWLSYIKSGIHIDIKTYQIDNNIFLWVESDDVEINLNDEIDFINACIELGKTPPKDRKDKEKKYYLRHRFIGGGEFSYLNFRLYDECYTIWTKTSSADYKTQFTMKEIEEIKKRFVTDLKDFELVEVEE